MHRMYLLVPCQLARQYLVLLKDKFYSFRDPLFASENLKFSILPEKKHSLWTKSNMNMTTAVDTIYTQVGSSWTNEKAFKMPLLYSSSVFLISFQQTTNKAIPAAKQQNQNHKIFPSRKSVRHTYNIHRFTTKIYESSYIRTVTATSNGYHANANPTNDANTHLRTHHYSYATAVANS